MVSPLAFRCDGCGRITPILDTNLHGEASELARTEGSDLYACAAYRGEGEPQPAACPGCGGGRMTATVSLTYHEDRVADFKADPAFPLADFFDWFVLHAECVRCERGWVVSSIDTKP